MQALRDVLLGAFTWIIAISLFAATIYVAQMLYGPPLSDRFRQIVFSMGGVGLVLAIAIIAPIVAAILTSKN